METPTTLSCVASARRYLISASLDSLSVTMSHVPSIRVRCNTDLESGCLACLLDDPHQLVHATGEATVSGLHVLPVAFGPPCLGRVDHDVCLVLDQDLDPCHA